MVTNYKRLYFYIFSALTILLYLFVGFSNIIGKHYLFHIFSVILGTILMIGIMFTIPYREKKCAIIIFLLATIVRIEVFPIIPSDDVNRYIFEGKAAHNGINPYSNPPNSDKVKSLRDTNWKRINHKDKTACYPPLTIYFFSKIYSFGHNFFKSIMIFFDLGSLVLLMLLIIKSGFNIKMAFLYALNPIIIYSFSGESHLDSIMIFFIIGATLFYRQKKWILMFIFFALSVQAKYVTLPCIILFINRKNIKYIWIGLLFIAGPFLIFGINNFNNYFSSLHYFSTYMGSGAGVNALFRWITNSFPKSSLYCMILFLISLSVIFLKRLKDNSYYLPEYILAYFTCLLLFSPTVHYWYITWIISFSFASPSFAWIYLTMISSLYFIAPGLQYYSGLWKMPYQAVIFIWVPFIILLIPKITNICRKKEKYYYFDTKSISVIIPTINEEENIEKCINSINSSLENIEIIVVDANSKDKTKEIAKKMGAQVLCFSKKYNDGGGRGGQIFEGVKNATGDISVIVHADTLLEKSTLYDIKNVLSKNPHISGGSVGASFSNGNLATSLIEIANPIRAYFFGMSFGDQIQFFRTKSILNNNLFPIIPLMEDVELSFAMQKIGQSTFLFGNCTVSSRQWQKNSGSRTLMIIKIFAKYIILRLFNKQNPIKLYKEYYK